MAWAVVLEGASQGASIDALKSWQGWTWPGWVAVGSLAQVFIVLVALCVLLYLGRRFRELRQQAVHDEDGRREAFERQHTPILSIEPGEKVDPDQHVRVLGRVHADGNGAAYNVVIDLQEKISNKWARVSHHVVRYVRAPGTTDFELIWRFTDRPGTRPARLEVSYVNMFHKPTRFHQPCFISDAGIMDIAEAPAYAERT
jgi:hypothetical protein